MCILRTSQVGLTGLCLVGLLLCPGCGPPAQATTQPVSATQPAPGATTTKALPPLPDRATRKLSELTPAIEKPANKPYPKELPVQASRAIKEAEDLAAAGNRAAAAEKLERAVGYDPDNPQVRRMLGMAYASLTNRGKALDNLRRAAKYLADDLEAQVLLGEFTSAQNRTSQAILDFRTALECTAAKPSEPFAAYALLRLGDLLEAEGYWTASLECFAKLGEWIEQYGRSYTVNRALSELVLHPQFVLTKRGELLNRLRRPAEAVEILERAYHRDRMHLPASRLLVEILTATKQYDRAEKVIVEMAAEPAQIGQVAEMGETLCLASGDKTMPARIWGAYRAKHPVDATLGVAMASAVEKLGQADEALAMVKSVLEKLPDSPVAGRYLAGLYARKGNPEEGLRQLAALLVADLSAARAVNEGVSEVVAAGLKDDFELAFSNKVLAEKAEKKYALHYVAGRLAQVRGKRFLAADQYGRAIDDKGDFLAAYEAIVDVYLVERRYDEVDRILKRLDKLEKEGYFASYLQGKVSLARGKPGEAIDALQEARKRNASFIPAILLLADAYAATGRNEDAERTYREAIDLQSEDGEVYRRLFEFYVARRQYPQAEAAVMNLLARQPRSVQGQLMLAELRVLQGNPDLARVTLAKLADQAPHNSDVELLKLRLDLGDASGLLPKADFDGAVQRLSKIIRVDPQKVAAKRMLAELLNQPGKYAQAAIVWGQLYEDTAHQSDVAKAYASSLVQAGQYAAAAKLLESLLRDDPKDLLLRRLLLDSLEKTRKYAEAIEHAQKWSAEADENSQRSFYYRLRLLYLYKGAKEFDKAQKLLDDWLTSADLTPTVVKSEKIRLYVQAEQYDRAVEYAEKSHKESPEDNLFRRVLFAALLKAKQYDKLEAQVDKWLGAGGDEQSVELYKTFKVLLCGESGKADQAEKYALEWIGKSPGALAPRESLLSVLIKAEKFDRASKLVDDWLKQLSPAATAPASRPAEENNQLQFCRRAAVQLLALDQKYDQAIRRADQYIRGDPNDRRFLSLKATALTELGRNDEAMAQMEKMYAMEPNDPGINNDLGYYYADRGVKLDQAEQMIRQALTGRSYVTAFQDSLAWVLYKQGKILEAGRIFERVLQPPLEDLGDDEATREVDHPVILDHAGDTYYRLGWKEKAVELWNKAIQMAKKETRPTAEFRAILSGAPEKIKAVESGREPKVAPLGQGVAEPKR